MALDNTFSIMDCKITVLISELNTVKKELNALKEQVTVRCQSQDHSTVKCRCQDHPLSEGCLNLANLTLAPHGKQAEDPLIQELTLKLKAQELNII